ncbi:hypothetical protein RJT34_29952 [Clitoria ternatea]|uniref:Uncharacterized protein n=1 Tax=Clitoria ternatea TaxID=43366 RepID=A0AAN9EW51_CLITE
MSHSFSPHNVLVKTKCFTSHFISLSSLSLSLSLSLSPQWNPIVGDAFTLSGDDNLIAGGMRSSFFLLTSSFLLFLRRLPVAGKLLRRSHTN